MQSTFYLPFYRLHLMQLDKNIDFNLDDIFISIFPDESDVQGVRRAGCWIPFWGFHVRGLQGMFLIQLFYH